ncbi:MAG: response regulator [Negativicutes bacterium]|nr:response regulator [Negativicutes bacterium]
MNRQSGRWRALVADDIPVNVKILVRLLNEEGLTADTVADGQEAVAAARRADPPYDIIFLDLMMPVMDGLTATRLIRGLPGYAQVPIVAVTANAARAISKEAYSVGVSDFVLKPVDGEQIAGLLAKHIQGLPSPGCWRPDEQTDRSESGGGLFGINYQKARQRLGCDDQTLQTMLSEFYTSYGGFSVDFDKALTGDGSDSPLLMVHNLAGVAANLGADGLAGTEC